MPIARRYTSVRTKALFSPPTGGVAFSTHMQGKEYIQVPLSRLKTLLDIFSPRRMLLAAAGLLLAQAAALAIFGDQPPGVLLSELIQLVIGILCILASAQAFCRSADVARYYWRWLVLTFSVWALAQGLGVYIDIFARVSLEPLDDLLFFVSVIPFGMLIFLDPDHEPNRFDRLHLLDFLQVCVFWVSVFLYFSPEFTSAKPFVIAGRFNWTRSIPFDGVLVATFLLRALLTKSPVVRRFFGRMAIFLFFSAIADSYADNLQPGHWFDLIWSLLLGIPLAIAATWKKGEMAGTASRERAQSIVINQFFPLLYPFFSLLILVQMARSHTTLASIILILGFVVLGARTLVIQHRLVRAQDTLEFDATHDTLTGLWNRGVVIDSLQKELQRSDRSGDSLGVMIADLDHFKKINDSYGHLIGDVVLQEVARRLASCVRSYDSVGRYGGEEFLIVVPSCRTEDIVASGERLRRRIAELPITTTAGPIAVTLSIGVVSAAIDNASLNYLTLLRMADDALYRAKSNGRNCVESARFISDEVVSQVEPVRS
jgi:diguanylate cyclase (GGDEF)-like protein